MWIHLGMVEWCIPSWVTLIFTLTSDLISTFFVSGAYLLSSNVSYVPPPPPTLYISDHPKLIVLNQKAESIINALGLIDLQIL